LRLGWRVERLHRLRRRSRGLEKQRTVRCEDERAICARPATCCLADSSSLSTAIQSTARGSYYAAKGTGCLWFMDGTVQPLISRLPRLPLTIDRCMGVKMLFRGSRPSVRGAGRVVKSYGMVEGKWYALFTFILELRITCTKARPNGAGLPCYSAARGIPAEGICTYVDVSLELAGCK
jgi:hypothetical protein